MDHSMINAFVGSCIFLLVASIGFLVKSWMRDVKDSNSKLLTAIERLSSLIVNIEKAQDQHSFQLQKLERDVETLQISSAYGRRSGDSCVQPEGCPVKKAIERRSWPPDVPI